jgi:hypothetical protein
VPEVRQRVRGGEDPRAMMKMLFARAVVMKQPEAV